MTIKLFNGPLYCYQCKQRVCPSFKESTVIDGFRICFNCLRTGKKQTEIPRGKELLDGIERGFKKVKDIDQ